MSTNDNKNNFTAVDFDPFAGSALELTFPATEAQCEVWTAVQMGDDASCAYNESMSLVVNGALSVSKMRHALQALFDRHESLRMTFSTDGATLCVNAKQQLNIEELDFTHLNSDAKTSELNNVLQKDVDTPFNLEHGPLFRVTIVKLDAELFQVVMCAHHLVCDGLSWAVLLPDLAAFYENKNALLGQADSYSDYADYLVNEKKEGRIDAAESYWLNQYANAIPVVDMPTDRTRPKVKTYRAHRFDYTISKENVTALKKIGAKNGCTFFVTLLSAYYCLLYRLTQQNDLVIGVMAAGNRAAGFNNLVGHCVNLLPIRTQIDKHQNFIELLKTVRSLMFDATEHQQFSFGSLIKKLSIGRDPSRIPLAPITFNIDQAERKFRIGELDAEVYTNPRNYENFELFLNVAEYTDNHVVLECTYNSDLFDESTMQRRMAEFEQLVCSITESTDAAMLSLKMLPDNEMSRINAWNVTQAQFPQEMLIHQLIEQQAASQPDKIALICGNEKISYGELDSRANQLAHFLMEAGVGADVFVGLALDRSIAMVVSQLAILKAGAAYIPLDPDYPADRLSYMIEDSQSSFLLTQQSLSNRFNVEIKKILIDNDSAIISQQPTTAPESISTPDSLAYVIYTSGSTGRPKGVMVQHSCVVNFLTSMAEKPGITPEDIMIAVTTLSFDIAVLELLLPLSNGAQAIIATRQEANDGVELLKLMQRHSATVMQATPATWRMLLDADWQGTPRLKILCGGEALPLDLSKALCSKVSELWNMYGPTEATVWASCARIDPGDERITIGRPIGNTEFAVVDAALQQQPIGVPGELLIGGAGIVRGYLNRPDLTEERFISCKGKRFYRTGDLVRYLENGCVEYLGRIDDQVKVRGFRIELGEIESVLVEHPLVTHAVVAVKEPTPDDVRLVAYYILAIGEQLDIDALRKQCHNYLPDYMVPQHFVAIDELPLTPNGKIDRRALPDPVAHQVQGSDYIAPSTEMEKRVAGIWQEVLKLDKISCNDNFFNLGGHSLLATRVIARLRHELDVSLPVSLLFLSPTIQTLAEKLEGDATSDAIPAPVVLPRERGTPFLLSNSQQRLWFLQQLYDDSALFNLIGAFRFRGVFDQKAFAKSIDQIISRHDIIRSRIVNNNGRYEFIENDLDNFELQHIDLRSFNGEDREVELLETIETLVKQSFNFDVGPLIHVCLVKMAANDHVMLVMSHPVVWDGWSFDVFLNELYEFYIADITNTRSSQLSDMKFQYGDYPRWHQAWMDSGEGERQLAFWYKQLEGASSHIELPRNKQRAKVHNYNGSRELFSIDKERISEITDFVRAEGGTLYMVLLSAFYALLNRYSEQKDLLIATQVQGRVRPEFESLIGPFVNTVLVRVKFEEGTTFRKLIGNVKQVCLNTFAHQDIPFENVIDNLKINEGNVNALPYQVMFTYQDTSNRRTKFLDIDVSQVNHGTHVAYTDMIFWLKETGNGLEGGLDYSTELFDKITIAKFIEHFNQLLMDCIAAPDALIKDLPFNQVDSVVGRYADDEFDEDETRSDSLVSDSGVNTKTQKIISDIWKEALELDEIDIYDNFFELGGQSLLSMQVLEKIRKETAVDVPVRAILMDSLAQIAEYCDRNLSNEIEPVVEKKSFAEKMKSRFSKHFGVKKALDKNEKSEMSTNEKEEYEKEFSQATGQNLFRGVFDDFQQALASAPSTKPIGYDNPEPAKMYKDRLVRIFPDDYPVLFWLSKAIENGRHTIFDLGGHIGVGFYSYQKYIKYPENIDWKVCDVEQVVIAGRVLAKKKGCSQLSFCTDYKEADGREIFFASGSLQYLELSLASMIRELKQKPNDVIVNMMPLYDGEQFATLQNIGAAFCPYKISNMDQFVQEMVDLGYVVIDKWENPDKECTIPFYDEYSLDHYDGFYFKLNG